MCLKETVHDTDRWYTQANDVAPVTPGTAAVQGEG